MAYRLEWLRKSGFARRCLFIADRFFQDAPGFILGNLDLIDQMARSWSELSACLALPEFESPFTMHDAIEVELLKMGVQRK